MDATGTAKSVPAKTAATAAKTNLFIFVIANSSLLCNCQAGPTPNTQEDLTNVWRYYTKYMFFRLEKRAKIIVKNTHRRFHQI